MELVLVSVNLKGSRAAIAESVSLKVGQANIEDVDFFCSKAFCGSRLWGVPRQASGSKGRAVSAVDLLNGATPFFEIYPDIVCLYLYDVKCESTAAWFYSVIKDFLSEIEEE